MPWAGQWHRRAQVSLHTFSHPPSSLLQYWSPWFVFLDLVFPHAGWRLFWSVKWSWSFCSVLLQRYCLYNGISYFITLSCDGLAVLFLDSMLFFFSTLTLKITILILILMLQVTGGSGSLLNSFWIGNSYYRKQRKDRHKKVTRWLMITSEPGICIGCFYREQRKKTDGEQPSSFAPRIPTSSTPHSFQELLGGFNHPFIRLLQDSSSNTIHSLPLASPTFGPLSSSLSTTLHHLIRSLLPLI